MELAKPTDQKLQAVLMAKKNKQQG